MEKIKDFLQNAIYGKHATPLPAKYVAIAFMAEVTLKNTYYLKTNTIIGQSISPSVVVGC